MLSGSGGASFTGLLDLYPSAAAAYSVRRLSSDYATPTNSEFSFGGALQFDGVNDYTSSSLTKAELGTSFTIGCWLKLDSSVAVSSCIYNISTTPTNPSPFIFVQTTSLGIRFYVNQNFRMSITINRDEWYYIALNYESSNWSVFVNGVSVSTYVGGLGVFGASNLYIGGNLTGNSKITIDEFSVWTQKLTPTQTLNQYNTDLGNFANIDVEPLVWYNCNEADGSTTLVNSGSGGASYNGTLNNFDFATCWVDGKANKGALLEITRSSDNLVKNFYYDSNNELSLNSKDWNGTTLSSWIGSDDGFVRTWYDQSGNGNDAQNITPSLQPKIVSSGSILTLGTGAKPCINFNDDYLNTPLQNDFQGFLDVYKSWNSTKTYNDNQITLGSTTSGSIAYQYSGANFLQGGTIASIDIRDSVHRITNWYHDGVSIAHINHNGTDYSASIVGYNNNSTNRVWRIGEYAAGSTWNFIGNMQEFIVYSGNQSANKGGIKSNINTYYSIYSPPSGIGTWAIGTTFIIQ